MLLAEVPSPCVLWPVALAAVGHSRGREGSALRSLVPGPSQGAVGGLGSSQAGGARGDKGVCSGLADSTCEAWAAGEGLGPTMARPWPSLENRPVLPERPLACGLGQVSLSEPLCSPPSPGNTNALLLCVCRVLTRCKGDSDRGFLGRCSVGNGLSPVWLGSLVTTAGCSWPLTAMWGGGYISYEALACSQSHQRKGVMASPHK